MIVVSKDGKSMRLHSDVQLAAFARAGWERVGESAPAAPAPELPPNEPPKTQNAWDEPGIDRGEWIERARALGLLTPLMYKFTPPVFLSMVTSSPS